MQTWGHLHHDWCTNKSNKAFNNSYLFAFHLSLFVLSHFACRPGFVLRYDGALYLQDMNGWGHLPFKIKRSQKYSRGTTIWGGHRKWSHFLLCYFFFLANRLLPEPIWQWHGEILLILWSGFISVLRDNYFAINFLPSFIRFSIWQPLAFNFREAYSGAVWFEYIMLNILP